MYKQSQVESQRLYKNENKIRLLIKRSFFISVLIILLGLFGMLVYPIFTKKSSLLHGLNIVKNFKGVTPDEAENLIKKNKDLIIVDVRSAVEFRGGKIAHAINVDIDSKNFVRDINELDKTKVYLFYSNSGSNNETIKKIIKDLGFENIYILDDGIQGWVDNKKDITKNIY